MPTYKITDPTTGKTMRLTGDSPPTEQELDDIFSTVGGSKQTETPAPKTEKSGFTADMKNIGREFVEGISNPKPSQLRQHFPGTLGPALNVAGQAGRAVGGTLIAGAKAAIPALMDAIPQNVRPAVDTAIEGVKDAGKMVIGSLEGNPIVDAASSVFNSLPEGAQNDWVNFLESGNLAIVPPAGQLGKVGVNTVKTGINTISDVNKLTGATKQIGSKIKAVKDKIKPTPTEDEALGQILQGKSETLSQDYAKGRKALSAINTDGVTTYPDLAERIKTAIGDYARKVDDELLKDPTVYPVENLTTTAKTSGGQVLQQNYVTQAIKQLDELYGKTGNMVKQAEIRELAAKSGLTKKEVNDLARQYGSEFDAFNPRTGEPPTSVNKQMYENTRKGLKEVARRGLSSAAAELDDTISALYNTQRLVNKNVEAVNRLRQKIDKRGIGEKVGRGLLTVLDTASFGIVKGGVLKLLPRGLGYKVKNFLDLEEALSRNLKIVNKSLAAKSDAATIGILKSNYVKAAVGNLEGMEGILQKDVPGQLRPGSPFRNRMDVGPVLSGRTVGEPYGPQPGRLIYPKQLPGGQGFTLQGSPYYQDVIDVPFTSSSRPIPSTPQLVAPETINRTLTLPSGQGFELVDRPSLKAPLPEISKLEPPKDDFIGSGLRAARERQAAQKIAKERKAENLVTRVQQMGGITAGKDYNARILRQNPDAKRVLRNSGGQSPDAIAYQLQAEGWPISSGDELIELLKTGKGRTIYNPENAEKLFNRDIRRAENAWIEEQLAKEQINAGAVREVLPDHQGRLHSEIGQEGFVKPGMEEKAISELTDFFAEMGAKAKQAAAKVGELVPPDVGTLTHRK